MQPILRFFGSPTIERDGRAITLPAKAVAILAFLASSSDPVPRDRLVGLFWGDSTEEAARKNLRNLLWTTRRALGDAIIVTAGETLALGEADSDVGRLVASSAAFDASSAEVVISDYRGPFLDGLMLADAPEFELWAAAAAQRFADTYQRAVRGIIEGHKEAGRWRELVDLVRQALVHDPLAEPLYREMMRAQARLGERAEALRTYDTLRDLLKRELGVDPLPETEAVHWSLASQAESGSRVELTGSPVRRPSQGARAQRTPFVGRRAEIGLLDEELRRAREGEARVALLSGELGIGKSRLWQEWIGLHRDDCDPLEARCLEATRQLPFAPLTELFSGHPCTQELWRPGSALATSWLSEVARLLPDLRDRIPDLPRPAALPAPEERRRVFEAFVQTLIALNARPLVVFIDDVHWSDAATLDWLGYAVHRMRTRPLLVVLAYRPDEAPPVLVHQLAAWGRDGVTRRIPLQRLDSLETASLISALGVLPEAAHRIQAQGAGNPYALVELTRAMRTDAEAPVPTVLADLVKARLETLPEGARQVLQLAAILEPDIDFAVLAEGGGIGLEATVDGIDALLTAGVLDERGTQYSFSHPLVATTVRAGLSAARRAFASKRAAEALARVHADHPGAIAARLAELYIAAGEPERGATFAEAAARRALELASPDEAIAFYRMAIEVAPTVARRLAVADVLARKGDQPGSRREYEAAYDAAIAMGDQQGAAQACLGIAASYLPASRPHEVVEWAERGAALLMPQGSRALEAQAAFLLGAGKRLWGGRADEAAQHLAAAAKLAQEDGLKLVASQARFELGNLRAESGDLLEAIRLFVEARRFASEAGDRNQETLALNNAAYHAMLAEDLPAARDFIAEALAMADAWDFGLARQYLYSTRGEIALAEADWLEAEVWFRKSEAEARQNGNAELIAKCRANMATAARGRGDLDSALILLEEAAGLAESGAARHFRPQVDLMLAEVYAARDERGAALAALAAGESRLAGAGYGRLDDWARRLRAELGASGRR